MGRLVSAVLNSSARVPLGLSPSSVHSLNVNAGAPETSNSKPGDDNFAERIVKYIPAEVIAFFLAADKMFPDPDKASTQKCEAVAGLDCWIANHAWGVATSVFLIGLAATPLYIWQQREAEQPWGVHAATASIAFVVWSYAVHAHVFVARTFSPALSGFLVLLFSLVSGFIVPRKKS